VELPYQPRSVLVSIAHDPGGRLRDIAKTLGITERSAYRLKDGRRNRYQIRAHLPLRGDNLLAPGRGLDTGRRPGRSSGA
jgi:hypothetical protein